MDGHRTVKLEDLAGAHIHHQDMKQHGPITLVHTETHTNSFNMGSMSDISEPSSPDSTTFDEADLLTGQGK